MKLSTLCAPGSRARRSTVSPATPRTLLSPAVGLALALLALAAPCSAQIKRWVDERGMVHYSDAPPPATQPASGPMTDVPAAVPLTPAEQAAAAAQRQQTQQQLAQPAQPPASAAPLQAPGASHPPAALPPADDHGCAAQWARYNAAYACMDPYRMVDGRIRPEAFEKCPVLAQPSCPAP